MAEEETTIKDEIQIHSKTDIFKIPVLAHILPEDEFDRRNEENMKEFNKSILKQTVTSRPFSKRTSQRIALSKNPQHEHDSEVPQLPEIRGSSAMGSRQSMHS